MAGSNENISNVIRPSNVQGFANNRRALSTIDRNIIGAQPSPCGAIQKGGVYTEKNDSCNKNSVIPANATHHPVTRKFAAELAGKEQQNPLKEVKASIQPISSIHLPKDYVIINAEDYDHDVPMFVQHTEAMLQEIDQMDAEVETDVIDETELVVDIDLCDKKNSLAVTEYIDDLYAYYEKTESSGCVPPNYMALQFDINERMRGILIDWLIEVHYKFELIDETLYLTVNLIDRFLAVQAVVRKKLQLVGVTAMLLACKYEEVSVPAVQDLILISDKTYCRKEVLDMEKLMINTLQFNLSVPTPYVFIHRFLEAAQSDRRLELLTTFMMELCLVEYEMLRFPPSLLTAAAIFTAQCTLSGCKQWSKTCERHTNYHENHLLECAKMMVTLHQKAGTGKLTGVYNKYSTSKYGYAARTDPAVFLVDLFG